jgi:hypothetical protein
MLSNILKYAVVWCAFCIAFPTPVCLPLFVTIICDFFLLFTAQYPLGVWLFCLVHLLYCSLLSQKSHQKKQQMLLSSLLPFGMVWCPLYFACFCYMACFCCHILLAFLKKKFFSFALGRVYLLALVLFALCDILTALLQFTKNNALVPFIWICYAPSQLLLAFAGKKLFSTSWPPVQIQLFRPPHHKDRK